MNLLLPLLIISISPGVPIDQRYPDAKQVFFCDFCKTWDENFDGWPDGWTRRRGSGFPHFVDVRISNEPSPVGNHCLRIDLDGAAAVAYSPALDISPLYSYVLEAQLKTEGLNFDRAYLSLTLLDKKRQRVSTSYSEKFKTTDGWKKIRIGPVVPPNEQVRVAVIGLHLQPQSQSGFSDKEDLTGAALFDDIWLARLPRMSLTNESSSGVYVDPDKVQVHCCASGFTQKQPRVELFLEDNEGRQIAKHECGLVTAGATRHAESLLDALSDEPVGRQGTAQWKPPVTGPGFYRVYAEMKGMEHLRTIHRRQELSFVVIDSSRNEPRGEFGWNLPQGNRPLPLSKLSRLLGRMGVSYIKYPLWYGENLSENEIEELYRFAVKLNSQGIELIGVLDNPPPEVLKNLPEKNNIQAADIFTSSPAVWLPSVETVLTRFANRVKWWQLGSDRDTSFVDCLNLNANIAKVKDELDRVDHDINLGISWNWINQIPMSPKQKPWRFTSLSADPPLTHEELKYYLAGKPQTTANDAALPKSKLLVVLCPIDKDRYPRQTRIDDLIRRMMTAKINGADAITMTDPFDPQHGLFEAAGMPGELLLPWRTTAAVLDGTRFVGQIQLPNGSRNQIFSRSDDNVMVVWNDEPTEEVIYLGKDVYQIDVWGRKMTPQMDGHRQVIHVGPTPSFVIGLNKRICLWRMSCEFQRDRIASIFGKPHQNSCRFKNTFPGGVSGKIHLEMNPSWKVRPQTIPFHLAQDEITELPFTLMLPYDAVTGSYNARIDCVLQAEEAWNFSVYRSIQVGLGDAFIEHSTELDKEGNLRVIQRFVNNSKHRISFRCQLSAPGRQRMGTRISNMPRGSNTKTYILSNGKELIGKT
ncbi:MAG: hypothetical protein JXM70_15455, partial [Pirellulales bacterium]|nr:hypothetical protein [Pirellulales bacterium]